MCVSICLYLSAFLYLCLYLCCMFEVDTIQSSKPLPLTFLFADNIDRPKLQALFDEYDTDKDGVISVLDLEKMLVNLGVAPLTEVSKLSSASSDKPAKEEA